tara:strand:- start:162 stop:677 length:516 start_codon:yes stop_codon:yes gene_type:complete
MTIIKRINGFYPIFGDNIFIAENATVIGQVIIGNNSSLWYNSVIRGDVNKISIGNKVNIQDGAIIHCTYNKFATIIGNNVSIGHNAIIHGCTIKDNVLIGMGAVIMDGAIIESNSIIAAGSVVTEGMIVESYSIYAGIPATKKSQIKDSQIKNIINKSADNYVKYSSWYQN